MEKNSKLILTFLIGVTVMGALFPITVVAEKFPLNWQAPTQSCDGSALTTSGLSSYKIYYNLGSGRSNPIAQPCGNGCRTVFNYEYVLTIAETSHTSVILTVPTPGRYHITMTAVNTAGEESCYSNEVVVNVDSATPGTPLNFEISLSSFN